MKIKTIVLMAFLCIFAINIYAQDIITKTLTAEDIQSIAVSGNVSVYITQGNSAKLKIDATATQHEALNVNISDRSLAISYKGKDDAVKVYVNVTNFKSLAASSGAAIILENEIATDKLSIALSSGSDFIGSFRVDELSCAASSSSNFDLKNSQIEVLKIALSGGSNLITKNMNVSTFNLAMSGGSNVNLSGSCNEMNLVTSGRSDVSADNLKIKKCTLAVSGNSNVYIHVTAELSINATGTSEVSCKGNPKVIDKAITKSIRFNM